MSYKDSFKKCAGCGKQKCLSNFGILKESIRLQHDRVHLCNHCGKWFCTSCVSFETELDLQSDSDFLHLCEKCHEKLINSTCAITKAQLTFLNAVEKYMKANRKFQDKVYRYEEGSNGEIEER